MSEPEGAGVAATGGGGSGPPTSGLAHERGTGTIRPLVLPETFDGTGSWSDWCFHFENVATVNGWGSAGDRVGQGPEVTVAASKRHCHLPGPAATSYETTRNALKARFKPESRQRDM